MKSPHMRQLYPLALLFLTMGLSLAMAYPFLALFLTTAVHADPVHVTIFLVVNPIAGMAVAQFIGRVSDRRPIRRRLLLLAAAAGIAALVLYAFVRNYWILLAVATTLWPIAGSMMPQGFAYARAVLADSGLAAMRISTLRTLFSLAWVGGPPLAALLLSYGGFSALYLAAAGMYAIALIVTFALLPEPPPFAPPSEDSPVGALPDAPNRTIAGTIGAFALLQGAGSVGVQILALFLAADLHSGVRDAGLILGLCAGLEIPLMLAFGALSTRFPVRRLIMVGPLCSIAYLLLAASATHVWMLFAGQLLNAGAVAAVQGLGVSYVQDLLPRHPGKASALFANSFTAGTVLTGPLIAGATVIGYRSAFVVAAAICAVGLALIALSRPPAAPRTVDHELRVVAEGVS